MSGEVVWTDAERQHAQIAEALCKAHMSACDGGPPRAIPDSDSLRERIAACFDCQRRSTALAPLVAERLRQARVEAISDLADEWQAGKGITLASQAVRATRVQERIAGSQMVLDWLRGRADAEGGESQ